MEWAEASLCGIAPAPSRQHGGTRGAPPRGAWNREPDRSTIGDRHELGTKLRALRTDRGHSIAEVADATGISASFLSLVENGRSDIAIGRLMRLIGSYGTGLATLFPEEAEAEVEVVRRDDYPHLVSGGEGLDLVLLAHDGDRAMTPFLAAYDEGGGCPSRCRTRDRPSCSCSTARVELKPSR